MKRVLLLAILSFACRRDAVEQTASPQSPQPEIQQQQQQQTLPRVSGPTLPFVDEATSDPALVAYRNELLDAVRRRDLDALTKLVDPNVRTSFGGGGGAQDFRETFQNDPKMWADLEQILTLGGTFLDDGDRKAFWAPYVYSAWPEASDAFTSSAVIADDVPLLDAPNGNRIATLSRNIVERVEQPGEVAGEWTQIHTADARTGFVATKFLRSPVGYRAGFNKEGERWRLTGLVAGD